MLTGLDPNLKEIVIETGLGGGDCGYDFRRGVDYIVYASKKPDGGWTTGICTPTRLVENAAEELKYFHQLAQAAPTAEVRVTAWDVHGARRTGGAVCRCSRVCASPSTGPVFTNPRPPMPPDATSFRACQPGEYTVSGSLEGYASRAPCVRSRCTPKAVRRSRCRYNSIAW